MKKLLLAALWICTTALANIALADIGELGMQNFMSYMQNSTNQTIADSMANQQASAESSKTSKAKAAPASNLKYATSAARSRINLANYAAKTFDNDPEGAKKMVANFTSSDMIGQAGKWLASNGLRADDISHVYTAWLMISWQAANSATEGFDQATTQAVKAQAAGWFLGSPKLAAFTDVKKQEIAEVLLLETIRIAAERATAANDRQKLQQLAVSTKKTASLFGIELNALMLTAEGFKSKGR